MYFIFNRLEENSENNIQNESTMDIQNQSTDIPQHNLLAEPALIENSNISRKR